MQHRPRAILIDLPTFPKGVLALSLVNVATYLSEAFDTEIIDLNFHTTEDLMKCIFNHVKFFGLKVSSQNFEQAKKITEALKEKYPQVKIVWGGELPTLLPEECLKFAHTVVSGLFEPVVTQFVDDLLQNTLQPVYYGGNDNELNIIPPRFDLLKDRNLYYSFMGLPMETSRGCTEKCAFCMVHVMQKKNYFTQELVAFEQTAKQYKNQFANIIDYNFGVSKQHVIQVAGILKNAGVKGWMAEMCIEFLDDDELLVALSDSGCRMIYCGLESIDDTVLASIHKMNTNHVANYDRIIRKAQSYGIQIAAGIILGIQNMNRTTFENLHTYFSNMGLIYAKLTFLTYNPGTKVKDYMKKKGSYLTEDISKYDGNHLSFAPHNIQAEEIYRGTENFIKKFYAFENIFKRSFNTRLTFLRRIEFILFNLCYRHAYFQWLQMDIFNNEKGFEILLDKPMKKSFRIKFYEYVLSLIR